MPSPEGPKRRSMSGAFQLSITAFTKVSNRPILLKK
jgi:hypothetical protein